MAGQVGQAISLNGTTQYASVPDASSLDLTTGMTLAAWIRPGAAATQDLIKKATNGPGQRLRAFPNRPAGQGLRPAQPGGSGDTYRINSYHVYPSTNGLDARCRHL